MPDFLEFNTVSLMVNYIQRGVLMILDAMTYSITIVVAAMSFVVILLASLPNDQQVGMDK